MILLVSPSLSPSISILPTESTFHHPLPGPIPSIPLFKVSQEVTSLSLSLSFLSRRLFSLSLSLSLMIMDSSASSSSQFTTNNFQEPLQLPTSPFPSFFDPLPSFLPTTTTTSSFPPPPPSTTSQIPHQSHNNSRQIKKRTRASRRAPTTILTTDTSNFRQMVQEFTGFPAPPFSPSSSHRPLNNLPYFLNRTSTSLLPQQPPININPFLNPHNNDILATAALAEPQFADLSSLLIPHPSVQPMQQLWNDEDENRNEHRQQPEETQKTASESWNANSSHEH